MKNILGYFYQIVLNDDVNSDGYFFYNNNLFQIKKYLRNPLEIEKLVILNNYMLINNIKINRIILNISNEPLSFYENEYYVLLKIDYKSISSKFFNNILSPSIKDLDLLKRNNWSYLWSSKVDYIEYQIEHLIHKYPLLYDTVNYYIGLSENAIMYYNLLSLRHEKLYINHRRINSEDCFFDPLELVIDYKVRDLAEYIKKCFFVSHYTINEIIDYLQKIELNEMDYVLLYTRLLFPSYYFDLYDDILRGTKKEEEILKITELSREFEILLKEVFKIVKKHLNILEISWIK